MGLILFEYFVFIFVCNKHVLYSEAASRNFLIEEKCSDKKVSSYLELEERFSVTAPSIIFSFAGIEYLFFI